MRAIDADALIDGYRHMGYDPNEHSEESYMEGWCKGFNAAVDHCIGHVIHAPTIEPERTSVSEWQKDFREYVGMLNIPRDDYNGIMEYINEVPSAQPEIIRCKDCLHWVRTCGDNQWGLGDCDVFDKHLVMCEGYCAWAERRKNDT